MRLSSRGRACDDAPPVRSLTRTGTRGGGIPWEHGSAKASVSRSSLPQGAAVAPTTTSTTTTTNAPSEPPSPIPSLRSQITNQPRAGRPAGCGLDSRDPVLAARRSSTRATKGAHATPYQLVIRPARGGHHRTSDAFPKHGGPLFCKHFRAHDTVQYAVITIVDDLGRG